MSGHIMLGVGAIIFLHILATELLKRVAERRARRHDPYAEAHGDLPFIASAGVALRSDAGGRESHPSVIASARSSRRLA